MLHGCVPVEDQLTSRLSAATLYFVLNAHIDDCSRLLDGGGVLWLDSYEAKKMDGGMEDARLDVPDTAVMIWTVLIYWELAILERMESLARRILALPSECSNR